jgi:two-component system alkaline phosphatase synthesis response regulator PhoP
MTQRILIVDDEPSVTDLLAYNFRRAHYDVDIAADGATALRLAREAAPDLILLDLMLPEIDGLDVCRELRKTSDVPIIMITARGEEMDRVVGLELGADDYVTKPFSVRELLARVKAVLRRTQTQNGESVDSQIIQEPNDLKLDLDSRTAAIRDDPIQLTKLEFDLLYYLVLNAGRVLTRERLLEEAWGYDYAGNTRAVDSAIKRLRAKLKAYGTDAEMIESVRGIGYRVRR